MHIAIRSHASHTHINQICKYVKLIYAFQLSNQYRSAFAPLYGNQYSGQQSNQYWSNSGSHYGSSGNATGMSSLLNKHSGNDIDGTLHNNNRKEKRQYKKRKHKNQREKQASGKWLKWVLWNLRIWN